MQSEDEKGRRGGARRGAGRPVGTGREPVKRKLSLAPELNRRLEEHLGKPRRRGALKKFVEAAIEAALTKDK